MGDRCRSRYHCVAHTSAGAAVTTKQDTLCPGCVVDIQKRYDELRFLADALKTMKGGSVKGGFEPRVNASREPGAPLNLHVMTLLEDIDVVYSVVDGYQIRDLVMQPPQEYRVWARDIERMVQLDGVDKALRVRRVHQRASYAVGLAPVRDKRVAPCPQCRNNSLGQWGGTDVIDCDTEDCGLKMPLRTYELYCIELSRKRK